MDTRHSTANVDPLADGSGRSRDQVTNGKGLVQVPDHPPWYEGYVNEMAQLSEEEKKEALATFNLLDVDKDGRLSVDEVATAVRSCGVCVSDKSMEESFAGADVDGNGTIDFDEFLQILMKQKENESAISEDELLSAFQVFDKNNDGFITAAELARVLTSLGDEFSEQQAKDMIKEADRNGDGMIDYAEFSRLMCNQA